MGTVLGRRKILEGEALCLVGSEALKEGKEGGRWNSSSMCALTAACIAASAAGIANTCFLTLHAFSSLKSGSP